MRDVSLRSKEATKEMIVNKIQDFAWDDLLQVRASQLQLAASQTEGSHF